ncbi:uncharacterized protein C8A04DRAFT_8956 [Dichotomopilus funicola]|uniref:Uncharacterized protein n=1 Tax=Dichotomopilus funicola TaxID=1934379 RepID=A0AAN6V9K9_9PEZI|nr:hypothetical protein C8A04DRAFT_8956 [Dichotomopilus funicola]
MMSSSRDPTARLRAGLNPLLTNSLGGFHNAGTPVSALSVAPHSAFTPGQTPMSAIQPYNPQEWIGSPQSGPVPDRMPHLPPAPPTQAYQEPQSSPLPPPPYSPPRSGRPASMTFDQAPVANVSVARAPPPPIARVATEPPVANTSFAPPPGTRGASRERRFGFPSLGRRREPEQASPPVEPPVNHNNRSFSMMSRVMPGQGQSQGHSHSHSQTHSQAPMTVEIPQPRNEAEMAGMNIAPGSRRAASTPAVATPTSGRSRSSSQVRWDPQMPVPPPPPGPPPSSSRSQSAQRTSSEPNPIMSPPTRRPPPSGIAALGPVPLTPANWRDGDSMPGPVAPVPVSTPVQAPAPPPPSTPAPVRAVETPQPQSPVASPAHPDVGSSSTSPAGGLTRSPAVRGDKAQTLLERRSESRTRGGTRGAIDSPAAKPQPLSDIVIPGPSGGLQRRLTINRGTPRTGKSSNDTPRTAESYDNGESRTPRAEGSSQATPTLTMPHSAGKQPERSVMAPKALPTPPTGSRSSSSHRGLSTDRMSTGSNGLHSPMPLSKQLVVAQSTEQFARGTIDRFAAFARAEAAAPNDAERVRLFAEFFVHESRMRRERYGAAIGAMGSEVLDLTRDLFRPMTAARRESITSAGSGSGMAELTPGSSEPRSHRGSIGSALGGTTPTSSGHQQQQQHQHAGAPPSPSANQNWQSSNYMPSLSPILSMSVSDAIDEEDSRGRPASRWWEADSTGAPGGRIERSKRESKYMGVPKEAREALQWIDEPPQSSPNLPGSSKRTSYPAEKTGWHDQEPESTPQPLSQSQGFGGSSSFASSSAPTTPNPNHLDVSRLVTLPPPYPRHHPAVNNNHPELAQTRGEVRVISDMGEIDSLKEQFKQTTAKMRSDAADAAKQRGQALRQHLQQQISSGAMGYAEAAAMEASAKTDEHTAQKDLEKKTFDTFQTAVVMPVNEILQSRITNATALFQSLRSRLFDETHESNPNLPQEEGDEQPELLEKLTLLKWIFEARESLHRCLYDLLSDRNDRYRDMVLLPYRLAGDAAQQDKLTSAEAFFVQDAAKRALAFAEESLQRTQEFRDVVEETVGRGVEVQLNAFWDIAPDLKRVLDKIPTGDVSLEEFQVQIPAAEYAENPSYLEHPLQYLFSLLLHAEKSTYQFIESQTNLLCLLHEVKEACVLARAKVMEMERDPKEEVEKMKAAEGRRLTEDLKERVRVVQDQWRSALGETVGHVKERVGGWLLETGGWDESFEEGGVGGV